MNPLNKKQASKPIMEKRRRARINSCLGDLKALIIDATNRDPARHSKLEKADILEMTVKYLQSSQRRQMAMACHVDPQVVDKFKAGFNDCANEVTRYLNTVDGIDGNIRRGIVQHLTTCITSLHTHVAPLAFPALYQQQQQQHPQTQQQTPQHTLPPMNFVDPTVFGAFLPTLHGAQSSLLVHKAPVITPPAQQVPSPVCMAPLNKSPSASLNAKFVI